MTLDFSQKWAQIPYTPKLNVYGNGAFVYIVKDSHAPAHYAQGDITIEITPPPAPEITKLEVIKDIDGSLRAAVSCAHCDVTKYQYAWVINGLTVGKQATYTPTAADEGFYIRLEVSGMDVYGQTAPMQYVTYKWIKVDAIFSTGYTFAALKEDGSVVTWGDSNYGGDSSSVAAQLSSGVTTIYSSEWAFAALKEDGSVVTWGASGYAGDSSSVQAQLTNVKVIYDTGSAFAALKDDGTVVTWGDPNIGGDSSAVQAQLTNVKGIYSNRASFAALKHDGTVVTWGNIRYGGDSTPVQAQLRPSLILIESSLP